MIIQIDDINLNVAVGAELGDSIIEDVKGVSVIIRRSLRDLLRQIPSLEVGIQVAMSTIPFLIILLLLICSRMQLNCSLFSLAVILSDRSVESSSFKQRVPDHH